MTFIRSKQAIPHAIVYLAALVLVSMLISCSRNGQGPVEPVSTEDHLPLGLAGLEPGTGHNFMGMATVEFDVVAGTAEVIPHRGAEQHINLTSLLNHPNCPNGNCLTFYVVGIDPNENNWMIEMNLWNPSSLDAYDVRLQFMGMPGGPEEETKWKVVNPDSYTHIWDSDPIEWFPPLDEPQPDPPIEQWMNPFIAFEKEDPDRLFNGDPDGTGPITYVDTELLILHIPPGSSGGSIVVTLDGCYPDHCGDPYEISHMVLDEAIYSNNYTDSVNFECVVADWEPDIVGVSLYLPDIIDEDDGWIELTEVDNWPPSELDGDLWVEFIMEFYSYDIDTLKKYEVDMINTREAGAGDYPGVVRAESNDPDGFGHDTLYNAVLLPCMKKGSGGSGGPNSIAMIVYTDYNDAQSDIYAKVIGTDGDPVLLTTGFEDSDELEVTVNEDGRQIAFVSNYDKVGGGGITPDFDVYIMDLAFSPQGDLIEGSVNNWTQITDADGMFTLDDRMPDYSPNGDLLAFSREQGGQFKIWTCNLTAGYQVVQKTFGFGSDEEPCFDRSILSGQNMYFQSNRAGGGNYEIYEIDPSSPESFANPVIRKTYNTGFDGYPTTYPTQYGVVVWTSDRYGNMELLMVDGFKITRLTENPADDLHPSFSPDGDWIAFMSDRYDHQFDIWRMDKEGGSLQRMTFTDWPEIFPFYANY